LRKGISAPQKRFYPLKTPADRHSLRKDPPGSDRKQNCRDPVSFRRGRRALTVDIARIGSLHRVQ
jgi:hypothetical protein